MKKTLICPQDRVPLQRVKPNVYRCSECGRQQHVSKWRTEQPNTKLKEKPPKKKSSRPAVPDITGVGPQFKEGIRLALDRVLAGHRDRELVLEDIYELVNDNRQGEQGNTRIDEFDPKPLKEISAQLLELLLTQELAKLFGLEKWILRKVIQNQVDRLLPPRRLRIPLQPPKE